MVHVLVVSIVQLVHPGVKEVVPVLPVIIARLVQQPMLVEVSVLLGTIVRPVRPQYTVTAHVMAVTTV